MSQIINITQPIHDSITVHIPYVNITAIRSIQVLHKCNENHSNVVKINCSLLENEENYGLIGHIGADIINRQSNLIFTGFNYFVLEGCEYKKNILKLLYWEIVLVRDWVVKK